MLEIMTRVEINELLERIFNEALDGEGINHAIRITFMDNSFLEGVKIIQNLTDYLIVVSDEQRRDLNYYDTITIHKNNIANIICPEIEF